MDADFDQRRRSRISVSLRENRWSMNSQRLEEIVAELMRPISDLRRSFDMDLSALLEEYLTEAGLRALEAEEGGGSANDAGAPNYPELALLLQQSASIYSRKVDFLYQHVLNVSESLQNSTLEISQAGGEEGQGAEEPATSSSSRRKRRASVSGGDFAPIEPEPCAAARRQCAPRPPPVLPRVYTELEPRVLGAADAVATDYAGEPIGVLADFHVCWRLQEGLLVEELCSGGSPARSAPLTLLQLQAALPPPAPLPPPPPSPPPDTPPPASPPPATPPPSPPPRTSTPLPAATDIKPVKERKRKNDTSIEDILDGKIKFSISEELHRKLKKSNEFSIPEKWIIAVVRNRRNLIWKERARLRKLSSKFIDFHGFDSSDIGGFCGWSHCEAAADSALLSALSRVTSQLSAAAVSAVSAVTAVSAPGTRRERDDSDDDGFFEQSSLGDSDVGRIDDSGIANLHAGGAEWAAWAARVAWRAARAAPCCAASLAARVLAAAAAAEPAPAAWRALRRAADQPHDVSRLFLATLFLANSGNVHIERGPPLSVDTFAVRVLSDDPALYSAAAQPAFSATA